MIKRTMLLLLQPDKEGDEPYIYCLGDEYLIDQIKKFFGRHEILCVLEFVLEYDAYMYAMDNAGVEDDIVDADDFLTQLKNQGHEGVV